MALDSADVRRGIHQELAALVARLPSARLAAVASEDGLLTATHLDAEPSAVDRRSAVLSSLTALARTAAKEHGLDEARWVVLSCRLGLLIVRPFGRQKRRLLLVVVGESDKFASALAAAKEFSVRIDARYGHKADKAATVDKAESVQKPAKAEPRFKTPAETAVETAQPA